MSIGSLSGIAGSIAGSPLAQAKSGDVERVQQEVGSQQHRVEGQQKAESAAGIGQTDEDQQAAERDADGRLPWRAPATAENAESEDSAVRRPQPQDPSGQSGSLLDLTG